jgi:hypothetical protein
MRRYYVDITGISRNFLEFAGYVVIAEDQELMFLAHKNDLHLVDKKGRQYLYVDDQNDADLLNGAFRTRDKVAVPQGDSGNKSN